MRVASVTKWASVLRWTGSLVGAITLAALGSSSAVAQQNQTAVVSVVQIGGRDLFANEMLDFTTSYDLTGDAVMARLAAYQSSFMGDWPEPHVDNERRVAIDIDLAGHRVTVEVQMNLGGDDSFSVDEEFLDEVMKRASATQEKVKDHSAKDQLAPEPLVNGAPTPSSPAPKTPVAAEASPELSPARAGDADQKLLDRELEVQVDSRAPRKYTRDDAATKLELFVRATGTEDVDRDELKFMLSRFRPGPLWLLSRSPQVPDFAIREPIWSILDQDLDGTIQSNEVDAVRDTLEKLDFDRDQWVTVEEAGRVPKKWIRGAPELEFHWAWVEEAHSERRSKTVIEMTIDLPSANRNLGDRIVASPLNQVISSLKEASDALRAIYGSFVDSAPRPLPNNPEPSSMNRLTVHLAPPVNPQDREPALDVATRASIQAIGDQAILNLPGGDGPRTTIRCWARQDNTLSRAARPQCSLATRFRLNQLWSTLDRDQDGSLGLVDVSQAKQSLLSMDANGDGAISMSEVPLMLDLVLCQGTGAVEELNKMKAVTIPAREPRVATPPDWFNGMDVNGDKLITQEEFLGDSDSFEKYDTDSNGWIDVEESLAGES